MVLQIRSKAELEAEFERAGDKLVVVDFYATWCGPCNRIGPIFERIAAERKSKVVLLKVDVDEVDNVVGEYAIEVLPTFVFKRRGETLDVVVGSSESKLLECVAKHA